MAAGIPENLAIEIARDESGARDDGRFMPWR